MTMYGLQRQTFPWNVGEDVEDPKAKMLAALQRPAFDTNKLAMLASMSPMAQSMMAPSPPQYQFAQNVVPTHVAASCGAPHLAGAPWEHLAMFLAQNSINVALPQRGGFDASKFYGNVPSKGATQELPLSSVENIGAGATGNLSQTVQKPFQGDKITLFGDLTSFAITSIIAAGQTVTASAGDVPASVYAYLDSWPNIGLPPLTSGASIVISVRNIGGGAATLRGAIRGTAGEG